MKTIIICCMFPFLLLTNNIIGSEITEPITNVMNPPFSAIGNGTEDDTKKIQNAIDSCSQVYLPKGIYRIFGTLTLHDGVSLIGEDANETILIQDGLVKGSSGLLFVDSQGPSKQISNITVKNLTLDGQVSRKKFSEFQHLVSFNGVKNVLIENVKFTGFRGDGLYLGSGTVLGEERHNAAVTIERCQFDGVNNDNRNAISVIDVDGIHIDENSFRNCSKYGMPGAIDFEPNRSFFAIIQNIVINKNEFLNIGGSAGDVNFTLPAEMKLSVFNVSVTNNKANGAFGDFFNFNGNKDLSAEKSSNKILLEKNSVESVFKPFSLISVRGVEIRENQFVSCKGGCTIGYLNESKEIAENISIINNKYLNCGLKTGRCLAVFNAKNLIIDDNRFINCGSGEINKSCAIDFISGKSEAVIITNNNFEPINKKPFIAIKKEKEHVFNLDSNEFSGNNLNGLRTDFQYGNKIINNQH